MNGPVNRTIIGVDQFGASASYKDNFSHYGFTVENLVTKAKENLNIKQ